MLKFASRSASYARTHRVLSVLQSSFSVRSASSSKSTPGISQSTLSQLSLDLFAATSHVSSADIKLAASKSGTIQSAKLLVDSIQQDLGHFQKSDSPALFSILSSCVMLQRHVQSHSISEPELQRCLFQTMTEICRHLGSISLARDFGFQSLSKLLHVSVDILHLFSSRCDENLHVFESGIVHAASLVQSVIFALDSCLEDPDALGRNFDPRRTPFRCTRVAFSLSVLATQPDVWIALSRIQHTSSQPSSVNPPKFSIKSPTSVFRVAKRLAISICRLNSDQLKKFSFEDFNQISSSLCRQLFITEATSSFSLLNFNSRKAFFSAVAPHVLSIVRTQQLSNVPQQIQFLLYLCESMRPNVESQQPHSSNEMSADVCSLILELVRSLGNSINSKLTLDCPASPASVEYSSISSEPWSKWAQSSIEPAVSNSLPEFIKFWSHFRKMFPLLRSSSAVQDSKLLNQTLLGFAPFLFASLRRLPQYSLDSKIWSSRDEFDLIQYLALDVEENDLTHESAMHHATLTSTNGKHHENSSSVLGFETWSPPDPTHYIAASPLVQHYRALWLLLSHRMSANDLKLAPSSKLHELWRLFSGKTQFLMSNAIIDPRRDFLPKMLEEFMSRPLSSYTSLELAQPSFTLARLHVRAPETLSAVLSEFERRFARGDENSHTALTLLLYSVAVSGFRLENPILSILQQLESLIRRRSADHSSLGDKDFGFTLISCIFNLCLLRFWDFSAPMSEYCVRFIEFSLKSIFSETNSKSVALSLSLESEKMLYQVFLTLHGLASKSNTVPAIKLWFEQGDQRLELPTSNALASLCFAFPPAFVQKGRNVFRSSSVLRTSALQREIASFLRKHVVPKVESKHDGSPPKKSVLLMAVDRMNSPVSAVSVENFSESVDATTSLLEEYVTEPGYVVDIAILPLRIAIQVEGPMHFYRGGLELRQVTAPNVPSVSEIKVDHDLAIDLQPNRTKIAQDKVLKKAEKSAQPRKSPREDASGIVDSDARSENRTLLPSALLRYQHLADAGWKVISLPYFVWHSCPNTKQRLQLLASLDPALESWIQQNHRIL